MPQRSTVELNDAADQAYTQFQQNIDALRVRQLQLLRQLQHDIDVHRIAKLHDQLQSSDE